MSTTAWLATLEPEVAVTWDQSLHVLAQVSATGIPVLPTLVIGPAVHHAVFHQADVRRGIERACARLSPTTPTVYASASALVRELLTSAHFPAALQRELKVMTAELKQHMVAASAPLPVRLTVVGGSHHSITGEIHEARDLEHLLLRLWSLDFTDRALYRRVSSNKPLVVSFPVLVQYYPEPEYSGTVRCQDIQALDDTVITIQSSPGQMVQGVSVLSTYRFDRSSLSLLSQVEERHTWSMVAHTNGPKPDFRKGHKAVGMGERAIAQLAKYAKVAAANLFDPPTFEWIRAGGHTWIARVLPAQASESLLPQEALATGISVGLGTVVGTIRHIHTSSQMLTLDDGDIAVVQHLDSKDKTRLIQASAVLCHYGTETSHDAAVARSLSIPSIVGLRVTGELREGQIVTVDATNGVVYAGRIAEQPPLSYPLSSLVTGTKLQVSMPTLLQPQSFEGVDGVGVVDGSATLQALGTTLEDVVIRGRSNEYADILYDLLRSLLRSAGGKPVLYRLHDTDAHPTHTNHRRRHEPNPAIGYRGAHRLLDQPALLELEVGVVSRLVQAGHTNLKVLVPMVRNLAEVRAVQKRIAEHGLEMWVVCETPASAILADELVTLNVAGVAIDVPRLNRLLTATDHDNLRTSHLVSMDHEALLQAVKFVIASCRAHAVPSLLLSELEMLSPEVVEVAVRAGVGSVSVHPNQLGDVQRLVAAIEQRLLLEHVLNSA